MQDGAGETARADLERSFRLLSDGTPVAMWMTDAGGQICFVNRAFRELFGDDATGVEESLARACARRTHVRSEVHVRRRDGQWRWVDVVASPHRDVEGRFVGMVCSAFDTTDRKLAEEELRRQLHHDELLMGVLSHDLRNPLGALLIAAESAAPLAETAFLKRVLEIVSSSGQRMRRMIEQILDLTRIRGARGLPLRRTPANLAALATSVADEVALLHPQVNLELVTIGDASGEWDIDRIAQLLSNLVGNAAQHAASPAVHISVVGGDLEAVRLRIHNEGVIPAELLPFLFEPFRRGANARSDGLGLGLYIASEIARAHGGQLRVESSQQAGTSFELELPRRAAHPEQEADPPLWR